jgi:4TM region of DNA translocase FtsK/SpoIIIE
MAKKKKTKAKSKKTISKAKTQEPSTFWPLAGAILLVLLALFLLMGGFGTGGDLPVNMFAGVYWALGWAAYLSPLALIYFGVLKFRSEDRKVPLDKFLAMLSFVVATAALLQALFASSTQAMDPEAGHGGAVGAVVGGVVLQALDRIPASLLFIVISVLALFLSFNISPKVLGKLFQRREKKDTDLESLKAKPFQT